jgi:type II secretory pathway pseudopilin PulG
MRTNESRGFSLIELVVSLGLTLAIVTTMFDLLAWSRREVTVESDAADGRQRLRVAVQTLSDDLMFARLVIPYQPGVEVGGPLSGSILVQPSAMDSATRLYYLQPNATSGSSQLVRRDGDGPDVAVVDDVAALSFEYLGDPLAAEPIGGCSADDAATVATVGIDMTELMDGPWCSVAGLTFDGDALRIRTVVVRLRTADRDATAWFEVSPRGLNLNR